MASTVISLQLNKTRSIRNPIFLHSLSSSPPSSPQEPPNNNNNNNNDSQSQSESESKSSFSSYFNDVKSSLKHKQQQPSNIASLDDIRQNLSEFRRRSAAPPPTAADNASSPASFPSPPPPRPSQQISFQELYKKNVMSKVEGSNASVSGGNFSFDSIRESLRQLRQNKTGGLNNGNETTPPPRSNFRDGFLGMGTSAPVFGGTDSLPAPVFGKEREKKPAAGAQSAAMKTEFVKMYTYGELGEKLRMLRPEEGKNKAEKWFSLGELNERLIKLREMEAKESEERLGGFIFKDLRDSLVKLQLTGEQEKGKKSSVHRVDVLGQLGGTPSFMLSPPKENLVEKYFHPDNMSSAEKMKIELKKVRDEFKMSESDCGSARVQVAQLTTKIKHLSTALHKKDKHSRKGLQAMVQRRKRLLKYLRRTDWDSYCLMLSKLGLRDNPDYKN